MKELFIETMDSIVSQNNQATEDIFSHVVLPYFLYKDLKNSSMINQTIEEYSYRARLHNMRNLLHKINHIKYRGNIQESSLELLRNIGEIRYLFIYQFAGNFSVSSNKNNKVQIPQELTIIACSDLPPDYIDNFYNASVFNSYNCRDAKQIRRLYALEKLNKVSYNVVESISNLYLNTLDNLDHLKIDAFRNIEDILPDSHNILFDDITELNLYFCKNITYERFDMLTNLSYLKCVMSDLEKDEPDII